MNFAAVLLAGGRSTRMGRDKAWLDWRGRPLWETQMNKLRSQEPEQLFISCRRDQNFESCGAPLIYDLSETNSPLEVIAECLRVVKVPMLVLAVDLPNMNEEVLMMLAHHYQQTGRGGVFTHDGRFEPLCAIYSPTMLEVLADAVARRSFALQDVVRTGIERGLMNVLPLPAEFENAFVNTNTPEEWTQAQPQP